MNPAGPPEWLVVVLVALVACVPLLCALTAIVTGRRALRAIRNSGGELQALMQESPLRRETAARVLARRGPGERATLLRVLFDATRPEVERAAAFTALRDVGGVQWRDHLRELLRLLGGTNFTLQTHVGQLLQWDGALPLSTLVRYVNDEDAAVRAGAVAVVNTRLLGMGGWGVPTQLSAADLPVLITALEQSGDRTVRLAVIEWITSMGAAARPARPALQAVANDPSDQQVASSAAAALTVIPK